MPFYSILSRRIPEARGQLAHDPVRSPVDLLIASSPPHAKLPRHAEGGAGYPGMHSRNASKLPVRRKHGHTGPASRLVILSLSFPLSMSRVKAVLARDTFLKCLPLYPCVLPGQKSLPFFEYRFVSAPSPLPLLEMLLRLAIHPAVFHFCPLHRSHTAWARYKGL